MHIAIVGAGAAGLAAARHATSDVNKFTCVVYERASQLGGTWVYTDNVGRDQNGFPIYSSMYKDLRTNLPKEVMGYPDFPIPDQERSYLKQAEMLEFLELYAENFKIKQNIQFEKHVENIQPLPGNRWLVTVLDVNTMQPSTEEFDAVMVCNGHYSEPALPTLPGAHIFRGKQMHSHEYRRPEPYAGKRVVVMGAGPSGMDLALQMSKYAKSVILSHHSKDPIKTQYPANVSMKPDVQTLTEHGAVFTDGSEEEFDVICYCTGYKYSFPFLDITCGITVDQNYISPLYKHMINITYPTMCFIGIPFNVCAFQMFDLQVRYFMEALSGRMPLPAINRMHEETSDDMTKRWQRGYSKKQAHMMGSEQSKYYEDLANCASITPILPVIVRLRDDSAQRILDDLIHFREDKYRILNNHSYVKIIYGSPLTA